MDDFGGVSGGFQTPFNTVGIGDPVPYGGPAGYGSGDLFCAGAGKKKGKKSSIPMATKPGPQCTLGVSGLEYRPLIVMSDKKK